MSNPKRSTLVRALKKRSKEEPMTIDGTFVFNAVGEDHRTVAITSATVVESCLRRVIENSLPHLDADEREGLFSERGMLSDFASKVQFGYIIKLYGPETKGDLGIIREIRNAFAHSLLVEGFDTKEVADLCGALELPKHFDSLGLDQSFGPPTREVHEHDFSEAVTKFCAACAVATVLIGNPTHRR